SISDESIQPGREVTVRWTAQNLGDAATGGNWTDVVYLSPDGTVANGIPVTSEFQDMALEIDQSRTVTSTVTIPDVADGDYRLVFTLDRNDDLFERDGESNNVFVLPQVITVGHPDVTGVFISPPTEVVAGNSLTLDWSESQIGTAATLTGFTTRIYLSQNDQVDAGDLLLSERLETEVWQPGRTQDFQADVTIPIELSGSYFLLLSVDDGDEMYELGGEGNNVIASPITLTVPPHADLVASNMAAPTLVIGDPAAMTVSWTVANTGEAATNADSWVDWIVLSSDEIFGNGDDRVVGQLGRNTSLPVGDSYNASADLTLPAGLAGRFNVFVVADAQGDVFENSKTANNVALAADKVEITPTPYADLVVSSVEVPPTASSGGLLEITWQVTNQGIGPTDIPVWSDVVRLARNPDGTDLLRAFGLNRNDPTIAAGSSHFGVLGVNQSYRRTTQISLPNGLEGTFYVVVDTGTSSGVFEHRFRGNNRRVSSATDITVAPSPDLIVEAITAPPEAKSGTKIDVEWTVRNTGDAAADGLWSDRVSLKPVGDPNANLIHLGIFETSLTLDAGLSYTRAEQISLAPELEGAFQVVVHSNFTGSLYEHAAAADNNVSEDDEIIVVSHPPRPDLQVTDIIAPTSVPAGGTISATYILTNRGTETTKGRWRDRVYLSLDNRVTSDDIVLGTFENAAALTPDESYQVSVDPYVVPKRFRGDVFVLVQTDFEDSIEEYPDEDNNLGTKSFFAEALPPADLVTSGVIAPDEVFEGTTIDVTYTVTNLGLGETDVDSWNDTIWLTVDRNRPDVRTDDILLGTFSHSGSLAIGEDYTATRRVTLPRIDGKNFQAGQWHVTVWSDAYNVVVEDTRDINTNPDDPNELDSNNYKARPITVLPLATTPSDLVVDSVVAPAAVDAGTSLTVQWTVRNQGENATGGDAWTDWIYVSTHADRNHPDAQRWSLGYINHRGRLEAGQSYTAEATFELTPEIFGSHVIVETDALIPRIYEGSFEDNNDRSTPITISRSAADLQITDIHLPATSESGEYVDLSWTVTNVGAPVWSGTTYWTEYVYLSRFPEFQLSESTLVRKQIHRSDTPLGTGESYTESTRIRMPRGADGEFYVYVWTDALPIPDPRRFEPTVPPMDNREGHAFYAGTNRWGRGAVYEGGRMESGGFAPAEFNNRDSRPIQISYSEPDLKVTSLTVPSGVVQSGQTVTVNWTVQNIGDAATYPRPDTDQAEQAWPDRVFLSRDESLDPSDWLLGAAGGSGANGSVLGIDESYSRSLDVRLPQGIDGDFYLIVDVDSKFTRARFPEIDGSGIEFRGGGSSAVDCLAIFRNDIVGCGATGMAVVQEFDGEADNTAKTLLPIELTDPPDLQVTSVVVPPRLLAGKTFDVEYTVSNLGPGDTPPGQSGWTDLIYLSRDPFLDRDADRYLGSSSYFGGLAKDQSYTATQSVRAPRNL
uniref:CARDB domain-containing protein n=1 Tax=Stieleria sp. TaxID=2795976 RepID=UPI00356973C0